MCLLVGAYSFLHSAAIEEPILLYALDQKKLSFISSGKMKNEKSEVD